VKRLGAFVFATGILLAAVFWLWVSLSLPFEDLNECGGAGGVLWVGFQVLQKLVATGGALAAVVCAYGATRYVASRGGLQYFFGGGATVSFTFFGWILMMGIAYTLVCS
jgi:hypothetical protein